MIPRHALVLIKFSLPVLLLSLVSLTLPTALSQNREGAQGAGESGGEARTEKSGEGQPARRQPSRGADSSARSRDKTRRDFSDNCLDAGCHAGLKETRWVHGPVGVGACDLCHVAEGEPAKHRFAAGRSCTFCHPPPEPQRSTHEPYARGDCGRCHDPHGGSEKTFLVARAAVVCSECHEAKEVAHPHAPVEQGDCLACHASHQSDQAYLLKRPEKDLCLGCHKERRSEFVRTLEQPLRNIHEPVSQACGSCHRSHGGKFARLLDQESRELCESCHGEIARGREGARSAHGAAVQGEQCASCHVPHSSDFGHLLKASPETLCLGCHDREITLSSGRRIRNIRRDLAVATFQHGPIREGMCSACHHAHSSPHRTLLRGAYPEAIYASLSGDTYELCFLCHDRRIIDEEKTTLTGFRDGDRNLHRVHVHQEKSRSCGICHEPHGSQAPKQMRASVSFGPGGWQLPIRFVHSESGGSCTSGCHQVYSYDNRTPPGTPARALMKPRQLTEKPEGSRRQDRD